MGICINRMLLIIARIMFDCCALSCLLYVYMSKKSYNVQTIKNMSLFCYVVWSFSYTSARKLVHSCKLQKPGKIHKKQRTCPQTTWIGAKNYSRKESKAKNCQIFNVAIV